MCAIGSRRWVKASLNKAHAIHSEPLSRSGNHQINASEDAVMEIRTASDADLSEIRKLLLANGLLVEDVSASLIEGFLVAEDSNGSVIGSIGLEGLGSSVLLRSLAVTPQVRGMGIARELVVRLEDKMRSCGQLDVWLLTTTAEPFF
jgi:amino-acid N-acetyltransferase